MWWGGVQAQGLIGGGEGGRQRREALGSPGLYLLALSGVRLTLIYNKVTFCYGWRQPLAQKVKAVKATQNFNITSRKGPPRPALSLPTPSPAWAGCSLMKEGSDMVSLVTVTSSDTGQKMAFPQKYV